MLERYRLLNSVPSVNEPVKQLLAPQVIVLASEAEATIADLQRQVEAWHKRLQEADEAYYAVGELNDALQQARREALEEAAKVVRDRALLWKSHGGAKMASPYGHLTVEGECEVIADAIDRLREGR